MIIGDSNLSRFPKIWDPRIQVDSFPGAKISHAVYLLRNRKPPSPHVTKVILSFGLNDLNVTNPSHLREVLGALYRAGQATFPNATVHVPFINFSSNLPMQRQWNLKQINKLIKTFNSFIPQLEKAKFNTTTDAMHWTPETANNVSQYWGAFLE